MLAAFIEVLIVSEHVVEHLGVHLAVKVDSFGAAKLYACNEASELTQLLSAYYNCIIDELLSSACTEQRTIRLTDNACIVMWTYCLSSVLLHPS